jgi:hypothetical protein
VKDKVDELATNSKNKRIRDLYKGILVNYFKKGYKDLHNLYSSPSIIRIIKSRRMKWAGHLA